MCAPSAGRGLTQTSEAGGSDELHELAVTHVPQQALQAALAWKTGAAQIQGCCGVDIHGTPGRLGDSGCTLGPLPSGRRGGAQTPLLHHQKVGLGTVVNWEPSTSLYDHQPAPSGVQVLALCADIPAGSGR